jgi:hypothetical protein
LVRVIIQEPGFMYEVFAAIYFMRAMSKQVELARTKSAWFHQSNSVSMSPWITSNEGRRGYFD